MRSDINDDPILDIRKAVATALRECGVDASHKEITDRVVDHLPDFFRQRLAATALADQQQLMMAVMLLHEVQRHAGNDSKNRHVLPSGCRDTIDRFLREGNIQPLADQVTGIEIVKLPYQDHPFVHGGRNGKDVWLLNNGQWTEEETHPDANIPFASGSAIADQEPVPQEVQRALERWRRKNQGELIYENLPSVDPWLDVVLIADYFTSLPRLASLQGEET